MRWRRRPARHPDQPQDRPAPAATAAAAPPQAKVTATGQGMLPGYCWRCCGRRVVTVAATASDGHGGIICLEDELPCPDCQSAPPEGWPP